MGDGVDAIQVLIPQITLLKNSNLSKIEICFTISITPSFSSTYTSAEKPAFDKPSYQNCFSAYQNSLITLLSPPMSLA